LYSSVQNQLVSEIITCKNNRHTNEKFNANFALSLTAYLFVFVLVARDNVNIMEIVKCISDSSSGLSPKVLEAHCGI